MSEIKVIDVGSCDGKINWNKISKDNVKAAILRITLKNASIDPMFESYYKDAISNGLKIGVYKFSYAQNVEEIKSEANRVIEVLKNRHLDYPVFLDLESGGGQSSFSKSKLTEMIEAFRKIIIDAGYKFAIYCNTDWYNNILDSKNLSYEFWIAKYPKNDDGSIQENIKVSFDKCVGWQFTEKYPLDGHKFDMSVFYKDYSVDDSNDKKLVENNKEIENLAIKNIINCAKNEVGYLEKKSNKNLDDKTANAGNKNYTKYWRDVYPKYQAQAWCACFVTWVFDKVFGKDTTKELLKHYPFTYCPTLGELCDTYKKPSKGDIVLFHNGTRFYHTGIVISVSGSDFTTIEGNTSNGTAVIANGGGVCQKSYNLSKLNSKTRFVSPAYSMVSKVNNITLEVTKEPPFKNVNMYLKKGNKNANVETLQTCLNKLGYKGKNNKTLTVDKEFGDNTEYAVKQFQNNYKMEADGVAGPKTLTKINELMTK